MIKSRNWDAVFIPAATISLFIGVVAVLFTIAYEGDRQEQREYHKAFMDGRESADMEAVADGCDALIKDGTWKQDDHKTCDRFRDLSKHIEAYYPDPDHVHD